MALLLSISRAAPGILSENRKVQREQPTILLSCSPRNLYALAQTPIVPFKLGVSVGGVYGASKAGTHFLMSTIYLVVVE
jgi:hypothetical protein